MHTSRNAQPKGLNYSYAAGAAAATTSTHYHSNANDSSAYAQPSFSAAANGDDLSHANGGYSAAYHNVSLHGHHHPLRPGGGPVAFDPNNTSRTAAQAPASNAPLLLSTRYPSSTNYSNGGRGGDTTSSHPSAAHHPNQTIHVSSASASSPPHFDAVAASKQRVIVASQALEIERLQEWARRQEQQQRDAAVKHAASVDQLEQRLHSEAARGRRLDAEAQLLGGKLREAESQLAVYRAEEASTALALHTGAGGINGGGTVNGKKIDPHSHMQQQQQQIASLKAELTALRADYKVIAEEKGVLLQKLIDERGAAEGLSKANKALAAEGNALDANALALSVEVDRLRVRLQRALQRARAAGLEDDEEDKDDQEEEEGEGGNNDTNEADESEAASGYRRQQQRPKRRGGGGTAAALALVPVSVGTQTTADPIVPFAVLDEAARRLVSNNNNKGEKNGEGYGEEDHENTSTLMEAGASDFDKLAAARTLTEDLRYLLLIEKARGGFFERCAAAHSANAAALGKRLRAHVAAQMARLSDHQRELKMLMREEDGEGEEKEEGTEDESGKGGRGTLSEHHTTRGRVAASSATERGKEREASHNNGDVHVAPTAQRWGGGRSEEGGVATPSSKKSGGAAHRGERSEGANFVLRDSAEGSLASTATRTDDDCYGDGNHSSSGGRHRSSQPSGAVSTPHRLHSLTSSPRRLLEGSHTNRRSAPSSASLTRRPFSANGHNGYGDTFAPNQYENDDNDITTSVSVSVDRHSAAPSAVRRSPTTSAASPPHSSSLSPSAQQRQHQQGRGAEQGEVDGHEAYHGNTASAASTAKAKTAAPSAHDNEMAALRARLASLQRDHEATFAARGAAVRRGLTSHHNPSSSSPAATSSAAVGKVATTSTRGALHSSSASPSSRSRVSRDNVRSEEEEEDFFAANAATLRPSQSAHRAGVRSSRGREHEDNYGYGGHYNSDGAREKESLRSRHADPDPVRAARPYSVGRSAYVDEEEETEGDEQRQYHRSISAASANQQQQKRDDSIDYYREDPFAAAAEEFNRSAASAGGAEDDYNSHMYEHYRPSLSNASASATGGNAQLGGSDFYYSASASPLRADRFSGGGSGGGGVSILQQVIGASEQQQQRRRRAQML